MLEVRYYCYVPITQSCKDKWGTQWKVQYFINHVPTEGNLYQGLSDVNAAVGFCYNQENQSDREDTEIVYIENESITERQRDSNRRLPAQHADDIPHYTELAWVEDNDQDKEIDLKSDYYQFLPGNLPTLN